LLTAYYENHTETFAFGNNVMYSSIIGWGLFRS